MCFVQEFVEVPLRTTPPEVYCCCSVSGRGYCRPKQPRPSVPGQGAPRAHAAEAQCPHTETLRARTVHTPPYIWAPSVFDTFSRVLDRQGGAVLAAPLLFLAVSGIRRRLWSTTSHIVARNIMRSPKSAAHHVHSNYCRMPSVVFGIRLCMLQR